MDKIVAISNQTGNIYLKKMEEINLPKHYNMVLDLLHGVLLAKMINWKKDLEHYSVNI